MIPTQRWELLQQPVVVTRGLLRVEAGCHSERERRNWSTDGGATADMR